MGRRADLRIVDPILSTLARGYIFPELACEALFPVVRVEKEAGKLPQFGKEAFRIYQTERALRAKSNRINPEDYDSIDIALQEHDLEYPIDYRERDEADGVLPLERWATNVVTKGLRIRCEKKCADLAQDPAKYAVGSKLALAADADKFDNYVNSDPLGVIDDSKDSVRQKIGTEPNTAVIAYNVWKKLKRHPQLLNLIKYSQKGVVTIDLLKEILEIPNLVIGRSAYDNEAGGALTDCWSKSIVLAYVPTKGNGEERVEYEPSYGYTFGKKNQPVVDTYVEGGKVQIIRNTDIFNPYIVGAEAGYLIYNAIK